MNRRWRRILVSLLLLPLVTVAAGGYWVLSSDRGSAWLAATAQRLLPALELNGLEGNFRDGLRIAELNWRDTDVEVQLTTLDARLDLWALWTRGLHFHYLDATRVHITVLSDAETSSATPSPLPHLSLPVGLSAGELRIANLLFTVDDNTLQLHELHTRANWQGPRIALQPLQLNLTGVRVKGQAQITLRGNYPLRAQIAVTAPDWRGELEVSGDLRRLRLDPRLRTPAHVTGTVILDTLASGLPVRAKLSLAEPWATPAGSLEATELQLQGELLGTVEGRLQAELLPARRFGTTPLELDSPVRYHWPELHLRHLTLGRPGQRLRADCEQNLAADPVAVSCHGDIALDHLDPWSAAPAIRLRGPWSGRLQFTPDWGLQLALPQLRGTWQNRTARGTLALQAQNESIDVDELSVEIGANRLRGSGRFGPDSAEALIVSLQAPQLNQLHPDLAGSLQARISGAGSLSRPDLAGTLTARELRWRDWHLQEAQAELELSAAGSETSRMQGTLTGLQGQGDLSLRAEGTRAQHQLEISASAQTGMGVQLHCQGENSPSAWQLRCPQLNSRWLGPEAQPTLTADQELAVDWSHSGKHLEITPFCLTGGGSRICLSQPFHWRDAQPGPVEIQARELPLAWLNHQLPAQWQFDPQSRIDANASVHSWAPLALRGSLTGNDLRARWSGPTPAQDWHFSQFDLDFEGDPEALLLDLRLGSESMGNLSGRIEIADPGAQRALSGNLALEDLQLAALAWALPDAEALQGEIVGRLALSGTTRTPDVQGQISLRNGGVALPVLHAPLREISLSANFDRTRARLRGTFLSGEGEGELEGMLHWPDEEPINIDLNIDARRLRLTPLPESELTLSPSLRVQATPTQLTVSGKVPVDRAQIVLQELPENATRTSPDAEVVGDEAREQPRLRLSADLQVALGPQFRFQGLGAEARLAGALNLRYRTGETPQAQGEITVPEGRYRAYGQRLSVRRGSVVFAGDATAPSLDIEAIRDLNRRDITVGVRITGTPQQPYAQLFSEPPMPETTAAYYLLTGKPPGQSDMASDVVAENLLMSLGLAGAGSPAGRLAERLGIEDLQLGTGTGAQGTEAQISAYLLPNLYVRYGVNLEDQANSITLQYQLTPNLFLEAVSGLDNALDLIYSFERRRPEQKEEDSDGK